jgi:hypothetical protein
MRVTRVHFENHSIINKPKGTPIWRLLMDPYITTCAGALTMVQREINFYHFYFFLNRQMLD